MHKLTLSLALALAAQFAFLSTPAQAQNDRSWVASTGSGSTCNRTSPCATFAAALAATKAGGEINCVDQGEFGGAQLFITASITIDCEGMQGRFGYGTSGSPAIVISATATDVVVLRGLDINGRGVAALGIVFQGGAALHVEKCTISNFASSNDGWGIFADISGPTNVELFVSDTVLEKNGTASSGGGIVILPSQNINGPSIFKVTLNRVEARNNYFGIKADGTEAFGGVINMTVRDSVASGNHSNGIVATGTANSPAIIMMIEHSTSSQNAAAGFGVIADGPNTTIKLTSSTVTGNINGIGASNGGQLISYQDNRVTLNSTDGNPTGVIRSSRDDVSVHPGERPLMVEWLTG